MGAMTEPINIDDHRTRPQPKPLSDYERGYITAEAYAALGVLYSGIASIERLRKYVAAQYSEHAADQVFPLE